MNWSPLQERIFTWALTGSGSAIVEAVAGSGKTTTLVEMIRRVSVQAREREQRLSIAFTAYNSAIATEIKGRVADLPDVKAGTFHAFGMGAWMKATQSCKVEKDKVKILLSKSEVPEEFHRFCLELVSLAKAHAIGVLTPFDNQEAWHHLVRHFELEEKLTENPLALDDFQMESLLKTGLGYAQTLLRKSISVDHEMIDFDDMIYAPCVHNARIWQNDFVLVDEAQDTNPIRRVLARKMLKTGGRLIAVGDPHQAIYGFTGADADALDLIEKEFNCVRLPLNVTYRCPKSVVRHAQQWVSHIEAAPSAPEGSVTDITQDAFDKLTPGSQDAILCRNTKPLVEVAYRLIKRGIACHVEGRDIGQGLIALATKWRVTNLDALMTKLEAYQDREVARLMAKKQEQRAQSVADRVETLGVIAQSLAKPAKVADLVTAIQKLFGDTEQGKRSPNVTLATIHKSKGREWGTVYLYGRNLYMPSKYARQARQIGQEKNLMYVAVTRAKESLVEVRVAK